jgi:flagellar biosynthesis/type III secretory pathway protein FliH
MPTESNKEMVREMLREVLLEFLEEKKGVLYDVLVEVIEDLALSRAIIVGEDSDLVDREEVMNIISGQA